MKLLLIILSILLSNIAFGAGSDKETQEQLEAQYCGRPAVEVDISKEVFEAGIYSGILIQLLSGNSKEASEELGNWLALKVVFLGKIIKEKPCNIKQKVLKRIYPILRVVAAVHEKTPILGITKNKEALSTLQMAIQDNPQHYNETLERSNNWENGIK